METYIREALFILFQVCLIIQLYFLVINQSKLKKYIPAEELPKPLIPVSVIISARNEAPNLLVNLPLIMQQNYHDFEVIVINDCSYDGTEEVLKGFKENYPALKIVTITEHDRFKTGKKFALTLGIKAAKNEHLLFTDADCKPASEHWISRMAANFAPDVQIVLGYSPYSRTRNFLNPLIRFETIKSAINYLSAAVRGDAYMGVGRNLAYTKTLFFSVKGFASHMHVLSGDDDLFVNQNATSTNTVIEISRDSFVYTDAKTSLGSLFRQKKRHMGAGKLYKGRHKFALSIDALSGVLFYILLTLSLVFNFDPLLALGLFMFRLIIQLIVYTKLFKHLKGKDLLWYFPFLDIIYYIYLNTFGFIGSFLKTNRWK
ncbi:glycosyltransferase [Mucilaginibacter sp. X4EP1]|uniref:glycosyltransferase n=1 Tax=Mucilaginibacter sp. X4EP1 TaxID=2723092 RepID=UPI00216981B5|nr:glycosyltransferase [Mucilaginibacter sp. X4EP1]MCS3813094.1 glycosyltransferase involved in cell wall biosynthesis [Mucilaginibacter sp. X4EP1]